MPADERRQYRRIERQVAVELSQFDESRGKDIVREAQSRNISAGGLLVTVGSPIEISSVVHAKFDIGENGSRKDVVAKVVRVDEVEPFARYDIGLQFLENLPPDDPALKE